MSTKLKDLIPILMCEDVQKSIVFYRDVLDFKVVGRMDDAGKTGWASLCNGKAQIMLGSPTYLAEPKKSDGKYPQAVYYFYPEDVNALRDSIVAKGYNVSELQSEILRHERIRNARSGMDISCCLGKRRMKNRRREN